MVVVVIVTLDYCMSKSLTPSARALHQSYYILRFLDTFRFYIFANLVSYTCRGCNPDIDPSRLLGETFDLFGEWESAFCTCLQRSTDAVLKTASECAIERPAMTGAQTKQRIGADHNKVIEFVSKTARALGEVVHETVVNHKLRGSA